MTNGSRIPMHERSDEIIEAARSYRGARWRHQGRNHLAVDCVGLIICIINDLKMAPEGFDYTKYPRQSHAWQFLKVFHHYMEPLPKVNDAVPGDALIVSCNGVLTHCGIIAIDEVRRFPTFIHSHVGRRGVVEDPLGMWLSSARRGFRFKQIVKVDL